jgi:hypothetical protein
MKELRSMPSEYEQSGIGTTKQFFKLDEQPVRKMDPYEPAQLFNGKEWVDLDPERFFHDCEAIDKDEFQRLVAAAQASS